MARAQLSEGLHNLESLQPTTSCKLAPTPATKFKQTNRNIRRNFDGTPVLPLVIRGGCTVVQLGQIVTNRPAFHKPNAIWPLGYTSKRLHTSMSDPTRRVQYVSSVIDGGNSPVFQVTAADEPNRPVVSVTASGAWSQVLKAVNGTPVKNMRHLVELLSAVEAGETTIDFDCGKSESRAHCVFDTAEAKHCEEEILGLSKVPTWCSPELLQ